MTRQTGFSLIEVAITVSLFTLIILALSSTFAFAVKSGSENVTKAKATLLAEEGLEAMRFLRDASWSSNIAARTAGSPYYLSWNNGWAISSENIFIDSLFERRVAVADVYRDGAQNIVASGGSLDPNIRKVTVEVSWHSHGATTTRSVSTYLANVFNN